MSKKTFDALVLGVGGMGSAACYQLARRGVRVAGVEQFETGHAQGSSHGETRTIRMAYFEHEAYVPILRRAYELWKQVSEESGRPLLHQTGVMSYGPLDGILLSGILRSAALHRIPIEKLDRNEAIRRFPGYVPPEGFHGVLEPSGGFLEVENCVRTHAELARRHGATIFEGRRVLAIEPTRSGVTVKTDQESLECARLVVTAGAWSARLLRDLGLPLSVHRTVLLWLEPRGDFHANPATPSFMFDMPYGFFYGVPDFNGAGVKMAEHRPGEEVRDPLNLDRSLRDEDQAPVFRCVDEVLPFLTHEVRKHAVCMYTMTPDSHFIVDRHPAHENIVFAAGFSGHGFKFSSVMGEILADLALEGKSALPIEFLGSRRFRAGRS